MNNRMYLCIDLKSFYASVECIERKLDPLNTNLVVADPERSEKTVCLAITPSMKKLGVKNRCRVFQIPKHIEYIMAPPRMKLYIEYSVKIYGIYLKYVAKEDIHVYSIDEVFMDITDYIPLYQTSARKLAVMMMEDVLNTTGITATAGMGTNLYLAKIAMDITAKHIKGNIGYLNEDMYRKALWKHTPLTDFWRVGAGTVRRLASIGVRTMKDIAHTPEEVLYQLFGIDAELLIDHAWGRESTTMADIKKYEPKNSSMSSGQVLPRDYSYDECCLIVKEMTDALCLELVEKGLVTNSVSLMLGYGRETGVPNSNGSASLTSYTNSYHTILSHALKLYNRIVNPDMPIRRISISFNGVVKEAYEQYDLFTDIEARERERTLQKATLDIRKKFGKNAIVRGMDLQEAATTMERNRQIGGHKSGE